VLGSVARIALPFIAAVAVGAVVTLGIRAALQDDSSAHGAHAAAAGDSTHAAHGGAQAAASGKTQTVEEAPTGLLVDLGNTHCPIMGGEVSGKVFTEWRGLRVGHCCPPCSEDFLEAPEEGLDELGIEWRPLVEQIAAVEAAEGEARDRLLTALRAAHDIVREPESHR
jgi:hypothetical protein